MKSVILKRDHFGAGNWSLKNLESVICDTWGERLGLSRNVRVEISRAPLKHASKLILDRKNDYGADAGSLGGVEITDTYKALGKALRRRGLLGAARKGVWVRFVHLPDQD